jgi:hypothetical protein
MKPAPANAVPLHGPYTPLPLRVGDRATCLYRDGEVVVTSWTDAPISWPRCRKLGHKGGSGLLVNAELERAVRSESKVAIKYHFGVSGSAVYQLRRLFGVTRLGTDGSKRLHQLVSERGGEALREHGMDLTKAEREHRSNRPRAMAARLRAEGKWTCGNPKYRPWSADELAMLDAGLTDAEVAERAGRTEEAVRVMRGKRTRSVRK